MKGLGIIAFLLLVVWWVSAAGKTNGPGGDTEECSDTMAYVMSQDFVRKRLKAPSTAEFPWGSTGAVTEPTKCHFVVRSYVDAENSFGAKLRSNYVVELQTSAGSDEWQATSVVID